MKAKELEPTKKFIQFICSLYDDVYDDRLENSAPPAKGKEKTEPGEDWIPGVEANHKSLEKFRKELEAEGIKLSTSKIRKVLITGGLWSTETSRTIQMLYQSAIEDEHMVSDEAVKKVADTLGVSTPTVYMNIPYHTTVYGLEEPTKNAARIRRHRGKKKEYNKPDTDEKEDLIESDLELWKRIITMEGQRFTTSGRGSHSGVDYKYCISRNTGRGGRHYKGESVDGYGNEMWIIDSAGKKHQKSISRSTVNLAWQKFRDGASGPKELGVPGAGSYLWPIFIAIINQ